MKIDFAENWHTISFLLTCAETIAFIVQLMIVRWTKTWTDMYTAGFWKKSVTVSALPQTDETFTFSPALHLSVKYERNTRPGCAQEVVCSLLIAVKFQS